MLAKTGNGQKLIYILVFYLKFWEHISDQTLILANGLDYKNTQNLLVWLLLFRNVPPKSQTFQLVFVSKLIKLVKEILYLIAFRPLFC